MPRSSRQRKSIFVSGRIQGSVLLRFAGYWVLYHFVLWHSLFLFDFIHERAEMLNGGVMQPFGALYWSFTLKYYPMLLAAFAVLPLLLYDSIRTTHRIAGPLVRFRNTLRKLEAGERVEEVRLRDGDLLVEFQNEFNQFLKFYNRQCDPLPDTMAPEDEMQLLDIAREIQQNLNSAAGAPDLPDPRDPGRPQPV